MPCAPDSGISSTVQVEHRLNSSGSNSRAQHNSDNHRSNRSFGFTSFENNTSDDPRAELSARAVDYLLNCHQELLVADQGEDYLRNSSMAATAKHEQLGRSKLATSNNNSGDEDIEAIAKQISDHAEVIYQSWKSRGLAPTEILNCHTYTSAADKFGSVFKPVTSPVGNKTMANNSFVNNSTKMSTSPVDILAQENNNLEKLVNNFVVEDKARIAAARQRSPSKTLPSSIQFALQKFEQNAAPQQITSPKTPTQLRGNSFVNRPSQIVKPQSLNSPPGSHHNEIFLETIKTSSYPSVQQKANRQVTSPTNQSPSDNHVIGSSWPLKNKIVNDSRKSSLLKSPTSTLESPKSSEKPSPNLMDEVAREEERLINALKTGAVISEEPSTVPLVSSSITVPKQKPVIIRETKPKVEPVKPILLSPSQVSALNSASLVNSVIHQANIGSPTSNGVKHLSKDELSAMSAVDYAKVRYRTAQQNSMTQQRMEEQKSQTNAVFANSEPIVSTTRSKFEPEFNREHNRENEQLKSKIDKDKVKDIEKEKESKEDQVDEKDDFIASRWGLRLNSPRPRPAEQVPHPELTTQQKQHIRAAAAASTNTSNNPVRPFLTRGSVAERVLIFEKCPSELLLDKRGPRQPATNNWRNGQEVQNKIQQTCTRDKVVQPKSLPPHTTLQRHIKANRNVHIPRFYFPCGKPTPVSQLEATLSHITAAFHSLPGHRASRSQFHIITKACDLPLYWKIPLFLASGGDSKEIIEMNEFLDFWKDVTSKHHDAASKFVRIVTRGQRPWILPEDLIPLVHDLVESHLSLTFLNEATEFHSRYVNTVIERIFYCVNRSWSGRISVAELRRSNLLSVIAVLEHEKDINQVTAYFSYEHFYVLYCSFWKLDLDHDLFIDKVDLTRYNDHALSTRIVERIFSGAVRRGVKGADGVKHPDDKMSYTEFVWFLLSEEDKNHPTAIEYWFRCMDLDGDGFLSMYELEYFYEEQLHRMEDIGIETLPFEDCLCQMLDMIKPEIPGKISLSDLKRCKMTSIFFDTFFNLEKYLDHEQRDPFASARDHDAEGHELSDWDRFAAEAYELLVAEESGNENDQSMYDSAMEDAYSPNLDVLIGESVDDGMVYSRNYNRDEFGCKQQQRQPSGSSSLSNSNSASSSNNSHYDSCDSDDYADSDN